MSNTTDNDSGIEKGSGSRRSRSPTNNVQTEVLNFGCNVQKEKRCKNFEGLTSQFKASQNTAQRCDKNSSTPNKDTKFQQKLAQIDHGPQSSWEARYLKLVQFVARYGHANVKVESQEDQTLSPWILAQRKEYELLTKGFPSELTPQRVQLLTSIGFIFDETKQDVAGISPEIVTAFANGILEGIEEEFKEAKQYGNVPLSPRIHEDLSLRDDKSQQLVKIQGRQHMSKKKQAQLTLYTTPVSSKKTKLSVDATRDREKDRNKLEACNLDNERAYMVHTDDLKKVSQSTIPNCHRVASFDSMLQMQPIPCWDSDKNLTSGNASMLGDAQLRRLKEQNLPRGQLAIQPKTIPKSVLQLSLPAPNLLSSAGTSIHLREDYQSSRSSYSHAMQPIDSSLNKLEIVNSQLEASLRMSPNTQQVGFFTNSEQDFHLSIIRILQGLERKLATK